MDEEKHLPLSEPIKVETNVDIPEAEGGLDPEHLKILLEIARDTIPYVAPAFINRRDPRSPRRDHREWVERFSEDRAIDETYATWRRKRDVVCCVLFTGFLTGCAILTAEYWCYLCGE